MLFIKPNVCSSVIKQTLVTVCGSYSFIKNFHLSCPTRELSQETRVKRKRKKRSPKTEKKEEKKTNTKINLNSSYDSLLEEHGSLKEKKSSPSYVFSDDIAAKIAAKILENRSNPSTPIIEYNPGPALLTKKLLNLGAKKIIGIESRAEFLPYLQDVQDSFGGKKFTFQNWDPFMGNLVDAGRMDKLHQNEKNSFYNIKPQQWLDDPYASIVGILNPTKSRQFLQLLQVLIGSKESIYSYGRPELFLLVPVKNYRLMIVKDPTQEFWTYARLTTIWNLFFDIETLLELNKSDVYPPFPVKRRLRCESKSFATVNKDSIYLVKMVPRKNLHPIANCSEEYLRFLIFLNQITKNKNCRLIPKLESWVPGCGLEMIRMGCNMLNITGDISPQKYLDIYQALRHMPEFSGSSLDAILSSQSQDIDNRTGKNIDQADQTDHLSPDST